MHVLVAFDKFKEALSAREACEVAARALAGRHPDWQVELCPLSDGGDGFETVLGEATGGRCVPLQVTGPRGGLVDASLTLVTESRIPAAARARLEFGPRKDAGEPTLAVIEMATASGLSLLAPSQRDPCTTTSTRVSGRPDKVDRSGAGFSSGTRACASA